MDMAFVGTTLVFQTGIKGEGILTCQSDIAEWGGSFFVDDFFPDHHRYTAEPAPTGLHFCNDFPAVWFWVITLNCVMVSIIQNKNCTFLTLF